MNSIEGCICVCVWVGGWWMGCVSNQYAYSCQNSHKFNANIWNKFWIGLTNHNTVFKGCISSASWWLSTEVEVSRAVLITKHLDFISGSVVNCHVISSYADGKRKLTSDLPRVLYLHSNVPNMKKVSHHIRQSDPQNGKTQVHFTGFKYHEYKQQGVSPRKTLHGWPIDSHYNSQKITRNND